MSIKEERVVYTKADDQFVVLSRINGAEIRYDGGTPANPKYGVLLFLKGGGMMNWPIGRSMQGRDQFGTLKQAQKCLEKFEKLIREHT